MKTTCQNPECNHAFEVYPYQLAKGQGKYCSKKCFGLVNRVRARVVCQNPNCGKVFEICPSTLVKGGRFCSWKCRNHKTPEQRFWEKVRVSSADKCWEWVGYRSSDGYGQLRVNDKIVPAHRFAWELHNGPIPKDVCCLHSCDHPSCCNPDHLWLGSRADNNADRERKGRGAWKLDPNSVREIRRRYGTGNWTQQALGKEFGVSRPTISNAVARKAWKGVK